MSCPALHENLNTCVFLALLLVLSACSDIAYACAMFDSVPYGALRALALPCIPSRMPSGPKLRAASLTTPFHVVLVEPEIPPNTGAVARTCAATQSPLHLVGTLGFRIDAQSVRRAGLDYWPLVDLHQHQSFQDFQDSHSFQDSQSSHTPRHLPKLPKLHLFSSNAPRSYLDAGFEPGDALVFGKESVGLSEDLLARFPDRVRGIPTLGGVRSLNLSNAVAVVLYEALRHVGALDATYLDMSVPS